MAVMQPGTVATPRPRKKKLTPEQFYASLDEDVKAELIDGEVIIMSPVSIKHDRLRKFLSQVLDRFVEEHDLGEVFGEQVEVRLGGNRYLPDVSFVASVHLDQVKATRIEGPADLVVEITLPETAGRDWGVKMQDYQKAGVREYWLVNPMVEQINVYILGDDGKYVALLPDEKGVYHSDVLPSFVVSPQWLWPGADQKPDVRAAMQAMGLR